MPLFQTTYAHNEKMITTISININHISFLRRIYVFPFLLRQPLVKRNELKREYKEWCSLGILDNTLHKFLYLIDHFFLWYFYSFIAIFKGSICGFHWINKGDFQVHGIHIKID